MAKRTVINGVVFIEETRYYAYDINLRKDFPLFSSVSKKNFNANKKKAKRGIPIDSGYILDKNITLSTGIEVVCQLDLYKSTYKKNAFTKDKKYQIVSDDEKYYFVCDNEGQAFSFGKEEGAIHYYFYKYFQVL